jgi:hypothetical protein
LPHIALPDRKNNRKRIKYAAIVISKEGTLSVQIVLEYNEERRKTIKRMNDKQ